MPRFRSLYLTEWGGEGIPELRLFEESGTLSLFLLTFVERDCCIMAICRTVTEISDRLRELIPLECMPSLFPSPKLFMPYSFCNVCLLS